MRCSPEKLAANRKNSLQSSGPKSAAGKEKSRRNSLKHGLTGAGIVIPDEDVAAVQERIEAFQACLKPKNEVAQFLANRAAVLSVRMDRCVRQEAAKITRDMIRAEAVEADERADELAYDIALIDKEPGEAVRHLKRSREGIDWLIRSWLVVLSDLFDAKYPRFIIERARRLIGGELDPSVDRRLARLALAVSGNLKTFGADEWPDLPELERMEAARGELKRFIEGQLFGLEAVMANLDHQAIARDQAGAQARAIFDSSKEAILARRYEAAAERGFFKTVMEIERINAAVDESEEAISSAELEAVCDELASCFPDEEGEIPASLARRSRGPLTAPSPSRNPIPSPVNECEEVGAGAPGGIRGT